MRFHSALLALPLALASTSAFADVIDYRFELVNDELCGAFGGADCVPSTLEFAVQTGPPTSYDAGSFTYYFPQIQFIHDDNGSNTYPPLVFERNGIDVQAYGGTLELYVGLPNGLYTGPTSDPTLLTGSGGSGAYLQGQSLEESGTVTVTDLTTASTPEPSTIGLLATGILGGIGVLRRRIT